MYESMPLHDSIGSGIFALIAVLLVTGRRIWIAWFAWAAILIVTASDFAVDFNWRHLDDANWLVFASRATRYLAPISLAIILIAVLRRQRSVGSACLLLRIAAAATFAAHGYGALIAKTSYVALISGTFSNIGVEVDPVTSGMALKLIGAVDIIAAGLVLVAPWRPVVAWMAAWGFIAAASRMTAYGLDAWYETAIRLPNGGVPLALLCLWWYRKTDNTERGSIEPPLNGDN